MTTDELTKKPEVAEIEIEKLKQSLDFNKAILKNLAQELSLPITNMKTAIRLLESMPPKRENTQKYLRLLGQECEQQNILLAALQEFIQLDQINLDIPYKPFKLADVIAGIVSTYQPLAMEKGVMLGYTMPAQLPLINYPEPWFKPIVQNLLHNSLKFTPPLGRILLNVEIKAKYLELRLSDTGVGIEHHELPHIFESFYRGHHGMRAQPNSAGLGLTVVKWLVERGGGTITVNSQLNKGSVFTVLLPLADYQKKM